MRSRGASEFVGVLGWPLEYTLSPQIHNAAFRRAGLDWVYLAWAVPPQALEPAVSGLRVLGARGANVTMPHKESVIRFLDEVSSDARAVGAVNTIQALAGRLIGHNTDVEGFRMFVASDAGIAVEGRSALVLGSGGAARAVVCALAGLEIARLEVVGRDESRAEAVAALAPTGRGARWDEAADLAAAADIVVNATPLGARGEDPIPDASLRQDAVIIDLVYRPPTTPLVGRARAAGARAWGGVGMLVQQAAASWRIWTGREPPVDAMSAAAVHALGSHRGG